MSDRSKHRLPEDPSGIEEPHDVLAADEFAMPVRDTGEIPVDPIHEPHDVLAAEEFAMPTGGAIHQEGIDPRTLVPTFLLGAIVALLAVRHFRD